MLRTKKDEFTKKNAKCVLFDGGKINDVKEVTNSLSTVKNDFEIVSAYFFKFKKICGK